MLPSYVHYTALHDPWSHFISGSWRVSLAEYLLVLRVYFSHCCRWHCVSWLLQELLLSCRGWGVSLGQASLLIPIFAFVDRDPTWHSIKLCWKLYFRTYLLPLYLSNSVCNNFYSYSDDEMYLWTLCNMWHVCWILYDLGCCKSFIETRRGTRRTTGFIWVQVW